MMVGMPVQPACIDKGYIHLECPSAVENGVTIGATASQFQPNFICTRGQVVTSLWRADKQTRRLRHQQPGQCLPRPILYRRRGLGEERRSFVRRGCGFHPWPELLQSRYRHLSPPKRSAVIFPRASLYGDARFLSVPYLAA